MESLLQVTEIFPASCNAVSKQATLKHEEIYICFRFTFHFLCHTPLYMLRPMIYAHPTMRQGAGELQSLNFKNSPSIIIDIFQLTLLSKFLLWERVVSKDLSGVVNLERGSHSSKGSNTWAS